MIIAYHVIFGMYGFWLPNDPRGSWSDFVAAWELFRAVYQMTRKPYVIGGVTLFAGYVFALVRREERPVSPELVTFRRHEQMRRLRKFLAGSWISRQSSPAAS